MTLPDWGAILTVFLLCAVKPGLGGIPAAVFGFQFNFLETLLICTTGSFAGIFVFTYLMEAIIKWAGILLDRYFPNRRVFWERVLDRLFPKRNKNKKKFTWRNRFIIRAKRNFGIIGVSAITPILLSYPLGIFLSIRFFEDRRKTLVWMCVFSVFWTVTLYFIFHFFHKSLQDFFA